MNHLKLCRTCFAKSNKLKSINEICLANQVLISELLKECCHLDLTSIEDSCFICYECLKILHVFYEFKKQCHTTQTLFENLPKNDEKNKRKENIEAISDENDHFHQSNDENYLDNGKNLINQDNDKNYSDLKIEKFKLRKNKINKSSGNKFDRKFKKFIKLPNDDGYQCLECNIINKDKKQMQKHVFDSHRNLKCLKCDKNFTKWSSFYSHVRCVHNKNSKCHICGKNFGYKNLRRHIKTVHNKLYNFKCEKCSSSFSRKENLIAHSKRCGEINTTNVNRRELFHKKMNKISACPIKLRCKICHRYFENQNVLDEHMQLHLDPNHEKFTCEKCEKQFVYLKDLKRHIWVHREKKNLHLCSHCGQAFAYQSVLKDHLNSHSLSDNYKCELCNKLYRTQSSFHIHMRIHLDIKRYKCEFCDHSFVQRCHLNRHRRQHTGEKPYCCDLCGRCFSDKSNRDAHRRIHTGEKPYECDNCDEKFYDAGRLSKHKRKVHPN